MLATRQQLLELAQCTLTSLMNKSDPSSLSSTKVHFPAFGISMNLTKKKVKKHIK
jgi:hypothetical protein